ncbi:MAG: PD-(D/E)XK nuclease family protein [Caldilineaceae bacterium]|nr:PD-(D/E)XK nuclease family protein [Caldilineaceae bacterium]
MGNPEVQDRYQTPEGEPHLEPLIANMSMHAENEAEQMQLLVSAIPALECVTSTLADSDAVKTATLQNISPKLVPLAYGLAEEQEKQEKGLNKLTADESLEKIRKLAAEQRNEFDALDFVGELRFGSGRCLWGSEEFHSDVLAWLLDPRHSHGLGDRFLTRFLLRAGMPPGDRPQDWTATEVTREWPHVVDGQQGYLDILIVNHTQQILCAIENKVFAPEFGDQLTRYRKALEESSYSTFTKYLVFLTPQGTFPAREEEKRQWKSLAYSKVFGIVQQIVDNNEIPARMDICGFLNQYATTLRRNIMPETSLSQLARKTYLENKEAIDLIIDNVPDWKEEAKQWLKEAIEQQPEWLLDVEDKWHIRFRTKDWDRHDATQTAGGWSFTSNAMLRFEFTFDDNLPYLQLALSPKNETNDILRHKLFEAVQQRPQLFNPNVYSLPEGWVKLHEAEDYILDESDFGIGWHDGKTRAKLEKWITDFAANEFPAMNEIIVDCLQEIDAEKQAS